MNHVFIAPLVKMRQRMEEENSVAQQDRASFTVLMEMNAHISQLKEQARKLLTNTTPSSHSGEDKTTEASTS